MKKLLIFTYKHISVQTTCVSSAQWLPVVGVATIWDMTRTRTRNISTLPLSVDGQVSLQSMHPSVIVCVMPFICLLILPLNASVNISLKKLKTLP